jgi:hypothetical protein
MVSLLGLNPGDYTPGALHYPDRTFRETNCYVDVWIELLHARGIDSASAMAFACTVDFAGDPWTFFKPALDEMTRLHATDVNETQLYRPVVGRLDSPRDSEWIAVSIAQSAGHHCFRVARDQRAWHMSDRTRFTVSLRQRNRRPNTATVESGGRRKIVPRLLQFGEMPARIAVKAMNADGHFAVAVERIA